MGVNVTPAKTVQLLYCGSPFVYFEPLADISGANAKIALWPIPRPNNFAWWPLIQISWYFSAGTAKTAVLRPHVRDAETGNWHALSTIDLMHDDATTDVTSQVQQFEVPVGHDAIALEIDLTNADERPHITLRPAAWVSVPTTGVF